MNSELHASDATIDPLLVAAKISTVQVDGKDMAAADAPLPAKIAALGKLLATGNATEDNANLIAANGQLAAQVAALEGKLTAAQATVSAQSQKITEIEGKLTTANASVTTLTAKITENGGLLKASTDENIRVTGLLTTQKTALAQRCIAAGCLDLKGDDGKALAADASPEVKLAAAMKLSHDDLFKAYNGAVNAAVAKTGVSFADVPATKPTGAGEKKEAKGRERFSAVVKIQGRSV